MTNSVMEVLKIQKMRASTFASVLLFQCAFGGFGIYKKLPENNTLTKRSETRGFLSHDEDLRLVADSDLMKPRGTDSGGGTFAGAKSKGTSVLLVPLVFLLKMTGIFFLSLAVVKFFLVKGVVGATIALIILGVILARKIRQFGTLTLLKSHNFYFGNGPGQYPTNEPDLSGFGYEYK